MNTPRLTALNSAQAPVSSQPDNPLLCVDQLTVTLGNGERQAVLVRDVDLRLHRGQTLGIVGESGSGKSLTARAITGLLPPGLHARGSVTYGGAQLLGAGEKDLRPIRGSRISLLLQDPFTMLNPLQTAGAHIAESLRDVRRDRSQTHAEVVRRLAEVDLQPGIADRYPFQLSGGMRQRVALASALAGDPELLIADEPTTALDVTTQDEVLGLLKDIQQRRGMALVLITHDLRVAFEVCDRIHVMYAGSVVESAPAQKLRNNPAHPYSHGLMLAEPPVTHYVDQLVSIPGNVPRADDVAHRCGFADRCHWVAEPCTTARPPLAVLTDDRTSACTRLSDIRGELAADVQEAGHLAATPPTPSEGRVIATLTDVRKTYRTTRLVGRAVTATALDGVSLTIREGESVGLVGETGSGKTTIARSILGLATPDTGRLELDGIDASDYRRLSRAQRQQVRRFVQVVFQDPYASLNASLTIGSTLREAANRTGVRREGSATAAELLARVGLPASYAGRKPAALSGGERQRVAIARALAVRPTLLICDEPVAALDVSAQAHILELLRDIRRTTGMSMLFITHDLSVVRQMTDRVVVLHHGEIVERGGTTAVLDAPQHPYTQRLVSALPGARPEAGRHSGHPRKAGDT
ncbi:ABC transporter ATP-binding protein [Streptomyces sp. CLV115]|uniref:ABC transporter ATP-binding protein n=1 Tax=Streptomyces sp. CLV115 TaxID=3138502 RepID=UPI00313C48F1